jgi:hypothetical protein
MNDRTKDQRFWQVRVIGTEGPKPRRSWWTVIVQAPLSADACTAAVEYAETHAPVGPKWMEFHADWVKSMKLPLMIIGDIDHG